MFIFIRNSVQFLDGFYYHGYLYTDEAQIIIDISMFILLLYFLLRCPDFVKSLAATGFKRINLTKYHIHESFIGILLSIGGIMLVMNGSGGGSYFERATGIIILLLGVFMLGRDWKDFTQGKFLRD